MTTVSSLKRSVVALFVMLTFVLQGTTSVLAGTTGAISGSVNDVSTSKPIAGARVTAQSPAQSATTTTDSNGRFSFVSLNPDTYTVSVPATSTYDAASVSGITVTADQTQNVSLSQNSLKKIGSVTSRSNASLVKPGTTADVYSISASAQDKASTLGGGGTLNSAWSAMSSVPGVFIAPNQIGYIGASSTISIRGGDYNQIGYELDGIPVNRSFDNYPSGPVSSLGQQELQVYTGATPANSESQGISGYINQVIRVGSAPAYRNVDIGIGAPTFYNKASFEAGGANPARTFSYYLGLGAYNQDARYYDQFNGSSLNHDWGAPLAPCGGVPAANYNPQTVPSCFDAAGRDYTNGGVTPAFALGPYQVPAQKRNSVRDTVLNFHFGIPRKDGNRDDVQLLYDNNHISSDYYFSTNDQGGANYLNAIGEGAPTYTDGYQMLIPYGTVLPTSYTGGGASAYFFPGSPGGRPIGAAIAPDRPDSVMNNQGILKLQYQRNFGTSAFLRVYGYTYYSDWINVLPQTTYSNFVAVGNNDYELNSHTRGLSATFSDQLNSQHLLSVQGSYTTASSLRYNNSQIGTSRATVAGYLVNGSDPYNGTCYSITGTAAPGCNFGANPFQTFTIRNALNGTVPEPAPGTMCGTGPCQYVLVAGGPSATDNTVTPKFYAASITDNWRPSERLTVNFGLRFDRFEFDGADTTNSGARTLFYNAYNITHPTATAQNVPSQVEAYTELQPRIGFTYSFNPRTVVRGSYGRYAEAPNSAFEQYNYLQPNDIGNLVRFGRFGLPTTPGHPVRPQVSNNYDLSLEHQFSGDTSLKLTPFLRKTQDQIQQFFLDQKTSFVSGLNVGRQTAQGFELEVDKGDFSRNGLAAKLSFTYTNSYINYTKLGSGGTIIDGFNAGIAGYNAYTAAGGGAPCYRPGTAATPGAADPGCTPGSIANPYYNAPIQPLMDPNANYATYDIFPGGVAAGGYFSYGAPYVTTLLLQYKHGPLAITPALQFSGGSRYGVPLSMPGVFPNQCSGGLPGTAANDPRYPNGAPGGAPYDAAACASGVTIPDSFTGRFDNVGAFVSPNQLLLHTQITYDVNKRLTLVGNFANIVNRCWGGTKVPFAVNHACNYTVTTGAGGTGPAPIGNVYNPGNVLQPFIATPYDPVFPVSPFNMYFEARIKI